MYISSALFPSGFPIKILHTFLAYPRHDMPGRTAEVQIFNFLYAVLSIHFPLLSLSNYLLNTSSSNTQLSSRPMFFPPRFTPYRNFAVFTSYAFNFLYAVLSIHFPLLSLSNYLLNTSSSNTQLSSRPTFFPPRFTPYKNFAVFTSYAIFVAYLVFILWERKVLSHVYAANTCFQYWRKATCCCPQLAS